MYIYIFHSHKNIIQYLYRIACFEIIDQRVIATGDPFVVYLQRVTSLAFLCYVLRDKYRRSPCFFFFSTQMLFAEEASQITRHYRGLSFLHGDWPWQTTNLSSLLSSPSLANLLLVWPFAAPYTCSSSRSNNNRSV